LLNCSWQLLSCVLLADSGDVPSVIIFITAATEAVRFERQVFLLLRIFKKFSFRLKFSLLPVVRDPSE
jgi:hypothetical protein